MLDFVVLVANSLGNLLLIFYKINLWIFIIGPFNELLTIIWWWLYFLSLLLCVGLSLCLWWWLEFLLFLLTLLSSWWWWEYSRRILLLFKRIMRVLTIRFLILLLFILSILRGLPQKIKFPKVISILITCIVLFPLSNLTVFLLSSPILYPQRSINHLRQVLFVFH